MSTEIPIRTVLSPGRYVQGKGALARLGEFVAQIGSTPLLLADDFVWDLLGERLSTSFTGGEAEVPRERFNGVASSGEIDRIVEVITASGSDVIVAVGGGSTIDAAKAAGHLAGVRWVSVPTVASTDAPTSALAVIYTEAGEFEEYRFFPRNPDLVLIDSQLVADAPARFLVAGFGDALATWLEARATSRSNASTMAGGLPTQTGTALAKLSWDVLWENAASALDAVEDGVVTPALERAIEANTLLSGLGFESGGLAAAHAIHNGLTAAPQTHGLQHGEKVNIGSIAQLILEGAPAEEIRDFIVFTTKLGLPTTLTEIGLSTDDKHELRLVAEAATVAGETIHNMPFAVTSDDVIAALTSLERLSRRIRAEAGLPEPVKYHAKH
ncbi:glycerol dehydrogenase [Pseudoclavibacter sp. RFBJ3]|uniref:glycerol dehydrogenase n=1 Tax=unclassified Pseudoclavibacter TaxID=2615177 RepID=UPI000CE7273C|nr:MULTISPECIES: glycerol dehydrogenase [unclassified Pseudoclavibacter]PPF84979.1 glycerol dehydrogenase [Pseudoclavibacter sp. RFBJ5]PPF93983.1 glycerol dehydrogenase [Pseudoclavibacter sp. RFBJ3]PPF98700.1 glycerol dehydrogenase [Pseudoclavibacter sp. RFBH5]PPG24339.1 glycerol dehydrogenase [Pseudoclavibacter sp. RFBI4]